MSNAFVTPLNFKALTAYLADVSTAGQIYVVSPFRGRIVQAWSVLNGTIDTANTVLTLKINGTAVTGGTITIAHSGSAAGDVDFCIPTAANRVMAGDAIEVETDGASGQTIAATITILIDEE